METMDDVGNRAESNNSNLLALNNEVDKNWKKIVSFHKCGQRTHLLGDN